MISSTKTIIRDAKFILRRAPQILIILICATIILNCAGIPAVATMAADTPIAQVDPSPTNLPTISPSPARVPTLNPPTPEPTPDNAAIWADYLAKTENVYPKLLTSGGFIDIVATMDSNQIIYETQASPDPEILIKAWCISTDGGQTFFTPCYYEGPKSLNSPLNHAGTSIKEVPFTMADVAVKAQLSDFISRNAAGKNKVSIIVGPRTKELTGGDFFENLYAKSSWLPSIMKFLETGDPTVLPEITVAGKTGRLLPGFRIQLK